MNCKWCQIILTAQSIKYKSNEETIVRKQKHLWRSMSHMTVSHNCE